MPKAPAHDKRIVGIVSASPGGVAHEKMTTQGTDNADNAFPMTRITSRSRQEKRRKIIPSGPTENDLLLTEACAEFEAYTLLAQTALEELHEPIRLYSAVLQDSFYLCATQAQALTLLATGSVAYLPVEIRIFRVWQQRWPDRFPELFQRTHRAKKDLHLVMCDGTAD